MGFLSSFRSEVGCLFTPVGEVCGVREKRQGRYGVSWHLQRGSLPFSAKCQIGLSTQLLCQSHIGQVKLLAFPCMDTQHLDQ